MTLNDRQEALCAANTTDFAGLSALFVNTSLKRQAEQSHTRLLLGVSGEIMARAGVAVEHVHMLEHDIPPGVYPDMTEHGWDRDDWPALWQKVLAAHVLVIGTPLWLGEESSVCRILIERLYGMSRKPVPRTRGRPPGSKPSSTWPN
jgi:multimeric flavodoxin WrbA